MPAESPVRDGNAPDFQLIETLRWEPTAKFIRLERHLRRLYASAAELGFACDPRRVGEVLATVAAPVAQRLRLALSRDGDISVATQPFEPLAADVVWKLRIARIRLDSADPLLRHKTTRRQAYMTARAEYPVWEADEMILLNQRGEVCEGTITSLFIERGDGGPLLTPPLQSGLLAGVLRGEMLAAGDAREAVLQQSDLRSAKALFVGNSLRGLIPAGLGL